MAVIEVNKDATHCIPLHPLYKNTGLSVDKLYAEVVVREDLASIQREEFSIPDDRYRVISNLSDLFIKDGEQVRNVYMLGHPGYGKTTFCLRLLKLWCDAKTIPNVDLSLQQFHMYRFHFVFYVSLRHHNRRSSIVEMICEDMSERGDGYKDVIRHVLRSLDHRCLVVVDGLDEWVLSQEEKIKLRQKGIPNTGGLSANCTVLFASRHWKIEQIQPKYSRSDIVVEILGLTDKGVDTIIHNILVNYFKLGADTLLNETKSNVIKKQIQMSKSSQKIPMFVTISVFLGYNGKQVQDSDTGLAMDQLELLIERVKSDRTDKDVTDGLDQTTRSAIDIPKIIEENKNMSQLIVVFYKLGRIALKDLISKESHLVFKEETLRKELGDPVLDIALTVGVVSQMRAPGRFLVPEVSIQFLHKSIQEAMAALYVVCDKSDAFSSLCEYCCSIDKVMEMSNVIQYITGFSPEIGCKLSLHIVHLAANDPEVVNEREMLSSEIKIIPSMFGMQCKCYKEMTHNLSLTGGSNPSMTCNYLVSDVYIDHDDDAMMIACSMMRGCPESIISFSLYVNEFQPYSTEPVLEILPQCSHLKTLTVFYCQTKTDPTLALVIPTLKYLQNVLYGHFNRTYMSKRDVDSSIVRALLQLPRLKYMYISDVDLGDDTLIVENNMELFKKIELFNVRMSPEAWERLVKSPLSARNYRVFRVWHSGYGRERGVNSRVVRAILQLPRLSHLTLQDVELDDDALEMTDAMDVLQEIELMYVGMSSEAWEKFGNSLRSAKSTLEVTVSYSGDDAFFPLTSNEGPISVEVNHDERRRVTAILKLPRLKHVLLWNITLDDDVLIITDDMTQLQKINLCSVSMSPGAWKQVRDQSA